MDGAWVAGIFGLVGVAVGAVATLAGPWLIEERKEKADRKKRQAEKLEELVGALYEHKHWLDLAAKRRVVEGGDPETIEPFAKAEAIATVYFPHFLPRLMRVELAAKHYESWMFKVAEERRMNESADVSGVKEARSPYLKEFVDLLNDIQTYAKSEFQ